MIPCHVTARIADCPDPATYRLTLHDNTQVDACEACAIHLAELSKSMMPKPMWPEVKMERLDL